MNSARETTRLVNDLAGQWVDPALEILKAAGIRRISVDMELQSWRTLRGVLRAELRWQTALRLPTLVSLTTLMEKVLRKATLFVAREFEPQSFTYAFETRIRRLAGERRATAAERRLYAAIVRRPELRAAFKPLSRTDFTPRLQVSALGA